MGGGACPPFFTVFCFLTFLRPFKSCITIGIRGVDSDRDLILSQFSIDLSQNVFASGPLSRTQQRAYSTPPQIPSWKTLGHTCPPPLSHSWIRHCYNILVFLLCSSRLAITSSTSVLNISVRRSP